MSSSADTLKQIIADKSLSWPQFAVYCGISYGQLLGWLTQTYLPDNQTVRRVAKVTDLDETDMII